MVHTRRTTSAKSKSKPSASAATRQRTLFDLFPAKSIPSTPTPTERVAQDVSTSSSIPITIPTAQEQDADSAIAPVVEKLRQTSLEPVLHPPGPLPAKAPPPPIIEIEDDEPPSRPPATSGSQEDPIIVESPTKPLKPLRPHASKSSVPKPPAPFFAPRRTKTAPVPSSSKVVDELASVVAPFPDKESQHVRGPQQVFSPASIPFRRLAKREASSTPYKVGSLKELLTEKNTTPSIQATSILHDKDTYLDTIPDEHRRHPAISRFTTASPPEGSAHRLWVDKWRPTRAAEVLGNEDNAIYLRDWIRALELQMEKGESSRGTKRRRAVVREVAKKRGKKKRRVDSEDEDDSWIVDDTEYFSSSSSPPPHDSSAQLSNTIILVGPCGSGKTAAVYACAEELGWDVLEVYPGIGRRNGAGIESLIGDAGKNHHVRNASAVRQSMILLEEVDILFKEDTNFWPAVTNFIKDCRRPVICTCNDITLVPTHDLPLQTILNFEACGRELAASYLQTLCFHEDGRMLNRANVLRVYDETASRVEAIPNPAGRGDFAPGDLRQSINRLSSGCENSESGDHAAEHYIEDDDEVGHTTRELFRAHQMAIEEGLAGMVPLSVVRMRRAVVHLEYAPRVREIVAAGRRRMTRRSALQW